MKQVIVGHRGVAGHCPENTKVSVQNAIDMGLKWVEVDVQPTKDEILVVCHDHTIDRCSNGQGRVDDYTLEQLQQLDFGSWFDATFKGEPIMTLASLLELAHQHQLSLNIEVKIDRQNVAHVAQNLKTQLDNAQLPPSSILLSSFSHGIIRELHQHCPGYALGVLSERLSKADWQLLEEVSAFSCNLNYRWVSEKHINALHDKGYQVWCYTVNQPEKFKHLAIVDGVFSDFPERFLG
ncbi:glycerophosphodiester phosphodiesterase family protein [Vibrio olivae]|uniref:Glycerophosphodiester phosphodiesterase family protein n=1 Tax=Vibrio olivae TaxID=1243002 RepID=A0ABV5HIJ8_9VIBR